MSKDKSTSSSDGETTSNKLLTLAETSLEHSSLPSISLIPIPSLQASSTHSLLEESPSLLRTRSVICSPQVPTQTTPLTSLIGRDFGSGSTTMTLQLQRPSLKPTKITRSVSTSTTGTNSKSSCALSSRSNFTNQQLQQAILHRNSESGSIVTTLPRNTMGSSMLGTTPRPATAVASLSRVRPRSGSTHSTGSCSSMSDEEWEYADECPMCGFRFSDEVSSGSDQEEMEEN